MRNLFSRVRPEIVKEIEKSSLQWPLLIGDFKKSLLDEEFVCNMTVTTASRIVEYYDTIDWGPDEEPKSTFLGKLWASFDVDATKKES